MRKVKITIMGKVHDVGYRPFLLNLAEYLFIERFDARNITIDGKQAVVVLVEGDESTINQFVEFVKAEKPENAVVEEIRVEDYDGFVRPIDSYRQSLMISQLNKVVQVGLKMLERQDLMLQKQDETIKVIKEESEKTREEIRELRMDLKSYLDERLKKIESEIEKIKAKLGML